MHIEKSTYRSNLKDIGLHTIGRVWPHGPFARDTKVDELQDRRDCMLLVYRRFTEKNFAVLAFITLNTRYLRMHRNTGQVISIPLLR